MKRKNLNKLGEEKYGDILNLNDNKKESDSNHDLNKKLEDNPFDMNEKNNIDFNNNVVNIEQNKKDALGNSEFQMSENKDNDKCINHLIK